jgi:glycosyltransferase involved in cell wall biosynthesis
MRVVMIVFNDMTADPRALRGAATLSAAGHDVAVLALRAPGLPDSERRDGFAIRRVADFTSAGARQPIGKLRQQRVRDELIRRAAIALGADVVHCADTPTLRAGFAAASELRVPFVYEAYELYPDSLQQQPVQGSWPVQAWWRSIEQRLIPKAEAVITVCDGLAQVLHDRYGVDATVVASAPPLRPIADRAVLRRTLGISNDQPIVLYQGGLFLGRALEPLVDAVARVPEIALVVQGQGPGEPRMRERVGMSGLQDRTFFMGQVPQDELFDLTCGADIGTCFLDGVTLNHRLAWPNRLFMYFMAGIPSVVTDLPGMASLVDGHDVGLKTAPGDVASMASALSRLVADAELRAAMGARARRLAEERFIWGRESAKLLAVYDRIERERPTDA